MSLQEFNISTNPDPYEPGVRAQDFVPEGVITQAQMEYGVFRHLSAEGQREYFIEQYCRAHLVGQAAIEATNESQHDPLTGIANRRSWSTEITDRLKSFESNGSQFAVMLFDLNKFKQLNDSQGHDAGDEVLKIFASSLAYGVRAEDTVARLGGDEFGALLDVSALGSDQEITQALEYIPGRIEAVLQESLVKAGHAKDTIGFAYGYSVSDKGLTVPELMQSADAMLYRTKHSRLE